MCAFVHSEYFTVDWRELRNTLSLQTWLKMTSKPNTSQQTSPDAQDQKKKYTGACHCGACRFECTGAPIFRVICHCSICTRISGGIAMAFVGFQNQHLTVIEGANHLRGYKATERMERFFCQTCGSNVYSQSLLPDRQFRDVPLANFNTDNDGAIIALDELKPDGHINFSNCQKCYSEVFKYDGLVKFSGMPGSATVENHPPSTVDCTRWCWVIFAWIKTSRSSLRSQKLIFVTNSVIDS